MVCGTAAMRLTPTEAASAITPHLDFKKNELAPVVGGGVCMGLTAEKQQL